MNGPLLRALNLLLPWTTPKCFPNSLSWRTVQITHRTHSTKPAVTAVIPRFILGSSNTQKIVDRNIIGVLWDPKLSLDSQIQNGKFSRNSLFWIHFISIFRKFKFMFRTIYCLSYCSLWAKELLQKFFSKEKAPEQTASAKSGNFSWKWKTFHSNKKPSGKNKIPLPLIWSLFPVLGRVWSKNTDQHGTDTTLSQNTVFSHWGWIISSQLFHMVFQKVVFIWVLQKWVKRGLTSRT